MFAIMQMFYARQNARGFWQESYSICVNKLMEARDAQQRLKRCVRRHRRAARYAIVDRDATQEAAQTTHAQTMEAGR
jgi:hypothetical protein